MYILQIIKFSSVYNYHHVVLIYLEYQYIHFLSRNDFVFSVNAGTNYLKISYNPTRQVFHLEWAGGQCFTNFSC